jgi:uncharacterized protein YegJ (DUF2314 family)
MSRRSVTLAVCAGCAATAGVILFLAREPPMLTMDEQLALGHDIEWVVLDRKDADIAAAIEQARESLPQFTKRVPRHNPSLGPWSGVWVGEEQIKQKEEEERRRAAVRRDPPGGPSYAVRVRIVGEGRVMPHLWLTHARYNESEDSFVGSVEDVPNYLPQWFARYGYEVRSRNVVDWRIMHGEKVEGAFTTRVLRNRVAPSKADERSR